MCFLRRPVLCVWNSETGTGFYPEKSTVIKIEILHKQKHHRILLYWTCEAVLQSEVLLMHEKLIFDMVICVHLVYHKVSTFLGFYCCSDFIIPKIRCFFMSTHQFM